MPTCYIKRVLVSNGERFQVKYRTGGRYTNLEHAGSFTTREEAEIRRAIVARQLAAGINPATRRGSTGTTWIYFIQSGPEGPIKIGVAADVNRRLRAMQTGNPETLRLLGKWWGTVEDERTLHRTFAHDRIAGEWFRPTPELLSFINGVVETP